MQTGLISKLEGAEHVRLLSPLGYHDMLKLVKDAKILLTDSGGMQKEALWLSTICITLRDTTEWVETIKVGANTLVSADRTLIINKVNKILSESPCRSIFDSNPYGDGKAAKKIIGILEQGD